MFKIFTEDNGDKIAINVIHVNAVYPRDGSGSILIMTNSDRFFITESMTEVVAQINVM